MSVNVAVIGSGFGTYCLLPAFARTEGCKVVGICTKNADRIPSYCRGQLNIYTDWQDMLKAEEPDAVSIAVMPKHQYGIAKYALENNMAVFAEKPLAITVSEARDLYGLTKKNKLPNMVDFIFPEIPEWIAAKKILDSGMIGRILNICVDWRFLSYDLKNGIKSWKTDVAEGGGALSFFFSHIFYYLEHFVGKIRKIDCVLSASEKSANRGETIVNTVILFDRGCTGSVRLDISYAGRQRHALEFHGESGTISLQNNSENVVDNFELTVSDSEGTRKIAPTASYNFLNYNGEDARIKPVGSIVKRFVRWYSAGAASRPDFHDGLRVQELIEMARISNSKFWE